MKLTVKFLWTLQHVLNFLRAKAATAFSAS